MLVSGTTGWDRSMSTRHALLNALLHGDASGYDLVKRFQPSAAHWWHPKPAQMYDELARMEADGLVSAETVIQTKYPNKRVFSLTETGRAELMRYAAVPSPPAEFKDELVIKMMGIDVADRPCPARRRRPAPQVVRRAACGAIAASVETMLGDQDEATFAENVRRRRGVPVAAPVDRHDGGDDRLVRRGGAGDRAAPAKPRRAAHRLKRPSESAAYGSATADVASSVL